MGKISQKRRKKPKNIKCRQILQLQKQSMISLSQIQTQKDKQYNQRRQSYILQKLKHVRINFRSKKSESKNQFPHRHRTEFDQSDDCENKQKRKIKELQRQGCVLNEGVEVCGLYKSQLSQSTMQQTSRDSIKGNRQYKQQEERLLNKIKNLMFKDAECQYQQQHQINISNSYYQTYIQLCKYCETYKAMPILNKILQSLTSTLLSQQFSSTQQLKQQQEQQSQQQWQWQWQWQWQSQQMTQQHLYLYSYQQQKQLQSFSLSIVKENDNDNYNQSKIIDDNKSRAYWVYACFLLAVLQHAKHWDIQLEEWVRVSRVLVNGFDIFGHVGLELLISLYRNIPQMLAPSHHSHITHLHQTLQILLNKLSKSLKQNPPLAQIKKQPQHYQHQHQHQLHGTNLCVPQIQQIQASIIYEIVQYMLHHLNIDILMSFVNFGLLDILENLNSCDQQYNFQGKNMCGVGDRLINICVDRCEQVKEDYKQLYHVIRSKYG